MSALVFMLAVWLLFALAFSRFEVDSASGRHWSYGTAVYYCFVTITTIGYGDYYPQTGTSHTVLVLY